MSLGVVLITGASQGIGQATATYLAKKGYTVYATMPDPEQWIAEKPLSLKIRYIDVTDELSISKVVSEILEVECQLDILINNAGIVIYGTAEEVSIDQAQKVFDVNFFGALRMMQAVLPAMRKQKQGLIINLSSVNAIRPSPGCDVYASSKFALEGLSEALASTLGIWNIKIVLLQPGLVTTNFINTALKGDRFCDLDNPYGDLVERCRLRVKNRFLEGQSPEEIAKNIEEIINDPQPSFRYQTSSSSHDAAKMKFVDPSGDKLIQQRQIILEQLLLKDS